MATDKPQQAKEKGNAAFKVGDYPGAIGHYTAAILADRSDATFPLNRAAAYLKLGKYEDAERDCNTVLNLSARNVKGYFRRGQARAGLGHFIEARRDFTEALGLEPDNRATKEELKKIAELIEAEKRKKPSSKIKPSFDATLHPAPAPKRRRVPITIVGPLEEDRPVTREQSSSEQTAKTSKHVSAPLTETIRESSSRSLKPSFSSIIPETKPQSLASSASASSQIPTSATSTSTSSSSSSVEEPLPTTSNNIEKPSPASFAEAKQAREVKAGSRKVGGGIFRKDGQSTIFNSRKEGVGAPVATETPPLSPPPPSSSSDEGKVGVGGQKGGEGEEVSLSAVEAAAETTRADEVEKGSKRAVNGHVSGEGRMTLFELVRAWRSMLTSMERWKLLQTIPPTTMPALCKTSLEPPLLDSILEVFLVVLSSLPSEEEKRKVREYMDGLARVSRFETLVMFLSGREKAVAMEVWRRLGVVKGKPPGAWSGLGSL